MRFQEFTDGTSNTIVVVEGAEAVPWTKPAEVAVDLRKGKDALPKLGGMDDTNVELIASLKPDVVLVAVSSRVAERLRALCMKVIALEPRSYKDVQRVLGIIGQVLGVPDAQRVWRHIEAGVAAVHIVAPGELARALASPGSAGTLLVA